MAGFFAKVWGWIGDHKNWVAGFGVAAIAIVAVVAIKWYVFGGLSVIPAQERSLEESWNDTIRKLHIEPRFPPEEDFVVGDLWAIVNDDDFVDDPYRDFKVDKESFSQRAVKLAHIDVNQALNEEYAKLPIILNASNPTPPSSQGATAPATNADPYLLQGATATKVNEKSPAKLTRDFKAGISHKDLPFAAFPGLKIQGTTTASAGLAAKGFWGGFGASDRQVEELELGEVRTYGLPTIRATELLDGYCNAEKTKHHCSEETARKQLRWYTRNRSLEKHVINANGDEDYILAIEIVMVYRVYVTSSIKNLSQLTRAQQGGARFTTTEQPEPPSTAPSPAPGSDTDAMKQRIGELERQLASVRKSNAALAETGYNRESSFQVAFERPVAIGFRGIRLDLDGTKKPKTP